MRREPVELYGGVYRVPASAIDLKLLGGDIKSAIEEEAKKIGGADFLAQGTLYPDVIESGHGHAGQSANIKLHHNVGGLPEELGFDLVEPVNDLFKAGNGNSGHDPASKTKRDAGEAPPRRSCASMDHATTRITSFTAITISTMELSMKTRKRCVTFGDMTCTSEWMTRRPT